MKQIQSIQLLRAVAALSVVAFHATGAHFFIGSAGVDVFFVISGYLMGMIGVGLTPGAFLGRRLIRIVPLYWVVTIFVFVCAVSFGIFRNAGADLPNLLKSLLFIPYRSPGGEIWPIVIPGWTLNFEMFFYAVFAIGLVFGRPIMFSIALLVLLVLTGALVQPRVPIFKTWTDPLMFEFLFGLLLSQWRQLPGRRFGLSLVIAALVLFAAASGLKPQAWRFVVWGVPAAMLVAGCLAIERDSAWPQALDRLSRIGDWSYSIYLLHPLVILAITRLFGTTPLTLLVAGLICVPAGYASFRVIERPSLRWLDRHLRPRRSLPAMP